MPHRRWMLAGLALLLPIAARAEPTEAPGSGLTELSIWQGINGLSLGIEAAQRQQLSFPVGMAVSVLGLSGGLVLPTLVSPHITTGQAMAIDLGGQLGAFNGAAWALQPQGSARDVAVGQLVGTLAGAALAHGRPPEAGRMAMAQSVALWASVTTALVQGVREDKPLVASIMAADAGAALGYCLWPSMPLSRGTLRTFDWVAGGGLVVGVLASGAANKQVAPAALIGLGAGAAIGAAIVAGLQLSDDDAPPVDLHVLPQPGGALLSVGARL